MSSSRIRDLPRTVHFVAWVWGENDGKWRQVEGEKEVLAGQDLLDVAVGVLGLQPGDKVDGLYAYFPASHGYLPTPEGVFL